MMSQLLSTPVAYALPWSRLRHPRHWEFVMIRADLYDWRTGAPIAWIAYEGGKVLNHSGEWEQEPPRRERDDAFMERTRFASAEEAAQAAGKHFAARGGDETSAETPATPPPAI